MHDGADDFFSTGLAAAQRQGDPAKGADNERKTVSTAPRLSFRASGRALATVLVSALLVGRQFARAIVKMEGITPSR